MKRAFATWSSRAALLVAAWFALVAACGWLFLPADALAFHLLHELAPPSSSAWLGRAENGVDVLAALVVGARHSLGIAAIVTAVSTVIGVAVGTVTGLLGGRADALILRALDVFGAFPGILLAVYFVAVLPPSNATVVLALCATGWIGFARVMRTSVMRVRALDHVAAARALGASSWRLARVHVVPLAIGPVVVQASFAVSNTILAEASLSFLGLGAPAGTPSWGALLDEGVAYLFTAPHLVVFPGACVALCVLAFNLLGDAMLAALEVRSRQRTS
jgi:peptide/nickel transport system permease protein